MKDFFLSNQYENPTELDAPLMRDDTRKRETITKMHSSGEHCRAIYHLVKSAMIYRTIGSDRYVR